MSNQYTIKFSDTSKVPITVYPKEVNNETSLTLFGKDTPNWATYWNSNVLHLLENFYCDYPPGYSNDGNSTNYVVEGQLWFDSDNDQLKICVSENPLKWDIICNNDSPNLINILTDNYLDSKLLDFIPLAGHNKKMVGPLLLVQVNHDEKDLTRLATKRFVDRKLCDCDDLLSANLSDYALLSGDIITGTLYLTNNYTNTEYAASKEYVDSQVQFKDYWYDNIEVMDDLGNCWLSDSAWYPIASDSGSNRFSMVHITGNFTFLTGLYSCYLSPSLVRLTDESYVMIHGGIKDNGAVSDVKYSVNNGVVHITRTTADIDEIVYFNIDIFEGGQYPTLWPSYVPVSPPPATATPSPSLSDIPRTSTKLWIYLGAFIDRKYYIANAGDGESKSLKWAAASSDTKADDIEDGSQNSIDLIGNIYPPAVAGQKSYPAAYFCGNLNIDSKKDWYMPARDELYYAYFIQETAMESLGADNLLDNSYWSSSEYDKDKSYIMSVSSGKWSNQTAKTKANYVRAIRSEPTTVSLKIVSSDSKPKIDSILTATLTGTTGTIEWYSGTKLTKITGNKYTVTSADIGNMISANVDYTDGSNNTHITSNFIYVEIPSAVPTTPATGGTTTPTLPDNVVNINGVPYEVDLLQQTPYTDSTEFPTIEDKVKNYQKFWGAAWQRASISQVIDMCREVNAGRTSAVVAPPAWGTKKTTDPYGNGYVYVEQFTGFDATDVPIMEQIDEFENACVYMIKPYKP
jgi:hypothetical protein